MNYTLGSECCTVNVKLLLPDRDFQSKTRNVKGISECTVNVHRKIDTIPCGSEDRNGIKNRIYVPRGNTVTALMSQIGMFMRENSISWHFAFPFCPCWYTHGTSRPALSVFNVINSGGFLKCCYYIQHLRLWLRAYHVIFMYLVNIK
jgi:hypothetical protein